MSTLKTIRLSIVFLVCSSWICLQSAQAQAPADVDEVTALRQRLDAYQAELELMRAELASGNGVQAIGYNDNSLAAEAAANADPSKPTIKKVDIISKPSVVLNGRIFYDAVWLNQSDKNRAAFGTGYDGNDFREIRLGAEGSIYENVQIQIEMDFAQSGRPTFNDENAINFSDLPIVQNVKVGRFKEPFSLEQMTSSRFITFMEHSLPVTAFTPGSTTGIGIWGYSESMDTTYGLGVFRPVVDATGDSVTDTNGDAQDTAVTGRLTHLCWYDEPSNGRCLMEIGGGASVRTPATNKQFTDGFAGFSTPPELRMAADSGNPITTGGAGSLPNFASTGNITNVNDWELYGVESAIVNGPFSIQAEGFFVPVNRIGGAGDLYYTGAYVFVSYFLTGENRNFDRTMARFDRITPYENFFRVRTADGVCCGKGAWEVAARYSYIDLNDRDFAAPPANSTQVPGGRQSDFTLGLNWYMNPYTRWMFNYVHADVDRGNSNAALAGSSYADLFGTRFQIDF